MAYNPSSYDAVRDGNRIPVAQGQSNTDATQTLPFLVNSITGRLLVDSTGGTGGGLAYLPLVTGAIDNSNKVFTFASTPTIVVVNGASYINGFGVTISGTTATLDNPVGTGGSIYALG